jgi:hypothetical protein
MSLIMGERFFPWSKSTGTYRNETASGLNSGVSTNCTTQIIRIHADMALLYRSTVEKKDAKTPKSQRD